MSFPLCLVLSPPSSPQLYIPSPFDCPCHRLHKSCALRTPLSPFVILISVFPPLFLVHTRPSQIDFIWFILFLSSHSHLFYQLFQPALLPLPDMFLLLVPSHKTAWNKHKVLQIRCCAYGPERFRWWWKVAYHVSSFITHCCISLLHHPRVS